MLVAVLSLAALTATTAADSFATPTLSLRERSDNAFEFRLAFGTEWDTNARRAIETTASPVVGDGVARLIAELGTSIEPVEAHAIELRYVLGAKRFFEQSTEDLIVHNLTASTDHGLSELVSASTFGSLRASRMRSGARDYSFGVAGGSVSFHPLDGLSTSLIGSWTAFDFVPDRGLSYSGPTAGIDAAARAWSHVVIGGRAQYAARSYRGPDTDGRERDDTEVALSVRTAYRGKVRGSLEYGVRIQRSTSSLENIDRHRVSFVAAIPLFAELTANVSAALQINIGTSVTDTKLLAEDDENQNNIQVGLSQRMADALAFEVRYALFANQFTTVDVNFLRQTIYAGVSYRVGD